MTSTETTNEDGGLKSKLITGLVNERKKVEVLNKDTLKRIKEHATSVK
jgi:hypothetical protein